VPYIEHPDDLAIQDNDNPVMIVNETFMNRYGAYYQKGDPVEILKYNDKDKIVPVNYPKIIGSVKNFKGRNLILEKPTPAAYIVTNDNQRYILARLNPKNQQETLKFIESEFKKVYPEKVFQYSFVDDEINTFMSILNPFAKLIYYGTIFAIFIASMGLFALALYITQQRTREIGIRRVFGASVERISLQLARQFIKLVLIAFIIAGPITFYGFRKMLSIFPEKIVLQWSLLLAIGLGILIIAIGTVFIQSWNAAKTDPVQTLRYE
jgi:putative ABC transport system permease protein